MFLDDYIYIIKTYNHIWIIFSKKNFKCITQIFRTPISIQILFKILFLNNIIYALLQFFPIYPCKHCRQINCFFSKQGLS